MNKLLIGLYCVTLSVFAQAERPAETLYQQHCALCHTMGVANAPRVHNVKDWQPRLAKGEKALMKSIHNGLNAMPAKGLCSDCTDPEYRSLIHYMSTAK